MRVGIVHYLNSLPLAWGFLEGRYSGAVEASYLAPAAVADRLASGALDVGLIPSAELQRIPDLEVIPSLCIASGHEVESVLLLSRVPLERIERLALDASSRTSAVLVRILLAERWGVRPEVVEQPPDAEAMLAGADAALLIGDAALRVDRQAWRVVDLAAEWRAWTGRPFVFAVWAARRGSAEGAREVVEDSFRRGWDALDRIVEQAAERLGRSPERVRPYFTESLSYRMGEAERASLEEFFRRGHAAGLLPPPQPLRFRR